MEKNPKKISEKNNSKEPIEDAQNPQKQIIININNLSNKFSFKNSEIILSIIEACFPSIYKKL